MGMAMCFVPVLCVVLGLCVCLLVFMRPFLFCDRVDVHDAVPACVFP